MQQGILALFGVCLALAISELLLPGDGAKRFLRFLTSLVILLLILTPFAGFLKHHEAFFARDLSFEEETVADYERILTEAVTAQSGKDLKAGLAALLQKEYGISPEYCHIGVYFAGDGTLTRVQIFLSGKALAADPVSIEQDLSARLGCPVEVR